MDGKSKGAAAGSDWPLNGNHHAGRPAGSVEALKQAEEADLSAPEDLAVV
jgi:hypothetical protein